MEKEFIVFLLGMEVGRVKASNAERALRRAVMVFNGGDYRGVSVYPLDEILSAAISKS